MFFDLVLYKLLGGVWGSWIVFIFNGVCFVVVFYVCVKVCFFIFLFFIIVIFVDFFC